MRFSQIAGVIATTGSVGHAFLIPTISKIDDKTSAHHLSELPPIEAAHAAKAVVQISCPGCPINVENLSQKASSGIENSLLFNFDIASGADADHLTLNDIQIYPVEPTSEEFGTVLKADQIAKSEDGRGILIGTPELGYMLRFERQKTDQDGLSLVKAHFEVLEVAGKTVTLPALDINLLETPNKKLMLGPINPVTPQISADCQTLLCRLKSIFTDRISKLKGCGGKPKHSEPRPITGMASGPTTKPFHGHAGGHTRPHGHHKSFRPHGHRRHGGFARFMRSLVFHVLIPIFLGVAMGVTASVVGIIVGHLAIFLWRALFRRNQPTEYQKVEQDEAAEGKEDSDGLLANQNPPPVYEEAPAYEEAIAGEKQ